MDRTKVKRTISRASRLASLRLNLSLFLRSLLFAILITVIWHQFHKYHYSLPRDAEVMLGTATLVVAAIFAVAVAILLTAVWENLKDASHCVLMGNQDQFMLVRDERMPFAVRLVLAASGLLVIVLLGAAHYPSSAAGILVIFPTAFVIMLCYSVVGTLQNVMINPWFRERVPPPWLEQSADEYFELPTAEENDG